MMTRRIQAYFHTEDEAEGAKVALIPYDVEGIEVGPLADSLDNRDRNRNILLPIVAYNGSSMGGGLSGAGGTTGAIAGGYVPGVAHVDELATDDAVKDGEVRNNTEISDADLDNLHYVMELKVPRENYLEVIETLRKKQAFVEVFE